MPGVTWSSERQRENEWNFAKKQLISDGKLLSNGTKLRRKDFPDILSHSFMVMDGEIIALSGEGDYLGSGASGKVKLAENEAGNLLALKIILKNNPEDKIVSLTLAYQFTLLANWTCAQLRISTLQSRFNIAA